MKMYQVALIDNTTVMLDIEKVVSVKDAGYVKGEDGNVVPQWMEVEMVSGTKHCVVPHTLMSAFEAEKVGYLKFQQPEEKAVEEE